MPNLLRPAPYNYGIHQQARGDVIFADWAPAGSHIFITTYDEDGPRTSYRGRLVPATDQAQLLATFGPYELLAAQAQLCDPEVILAATWQAGDPSAIPPTASLFVQLLDQSGNLIAQADGPPLGLRADLLELAPGWRIEDLRRLPAGEGQAERLLIGVYDYATGQRLPATDVAGRQLADNALVLPLSECN